MQRSRSNSRAGTTLVEITIGLAFFAVFAGAAFLAVASSSRSYGTESVSAELDRQARQAMDQLSGYLQAADFASLTPTGVAAPNSASSIDFQRARGFVNGAVDWGPTERLAFQSEASDPVDGADNDGDGSIDEGQLVLIENPGAVGERQTVLCHGVSYALEGETSGNGLDDNSNGLIDERGFCVEYTDSRLTVHLTMEALDHERNRIQCTLSRSTTPRNTPED